MSMSSYNKIENFTLQHFATSIGSINIFKILNKVIGISITFGTLGIFFRGSYTIIFPHPKNNINLKKIANLQVVW